VGVPFLERGRHGARLTREGLLFLESDRRFDIERATLIGAASELGARRARSLRVGLTHAASDGPAVQALARMMRSRSGLRAARSSPSATTSPSSDFTPGVLVSQSSDPTTAKSRHSTLPAPTNRSI
jgi:DNA-binding transcriptional LysR family regulator